MLSSVSISKGPSNDPSATGAIAGHVAMRTLTADDIVPEGKTWGLRLRGGFSGNSTAPVRGVQRGLGVPSRVYIASNAPQIMPRVLGTPSSYGFSLPEERPNWWEATSGNGSIAAAVKRENIELVAALSHRQRGNYFAGSDGNYARAILREPPETRRNPVTQDYLDYLDTRFPGHGLRLGDEIVTTTAWYTNPGQSAYRAGEEVTNTSNQLSSGLLKGAMTFAGGHRVELSYLRNETKYGFVWPTAQAFVDFGNLGSPQGQLSNAQSDMVSGKYRYAPQNNDLIDINLNTWFSKQDVTEFIDFSGAWQDDVQAWARDVESPTAGFDLSNRSRFASTWGGIALRYGIAYLTQEVSVKNQEDPDSEVAATERSRRQWDVFLDTSWEPTDWLRLDAGLRYMLAKKMPTMAGSIGAEKPPRSIDTERKSRGFAPSIGLTLEPLDGLQFYGTLKRGWRVPSPVEYSDFSPNSISPPVFGGDPMLSSGPELRNEQSTNGEIGANWLHDGVLQAGDTLGAKVSYFVNNIDNYISNELLETPEGRLASQTVNLDRATFSGIELSARYDSDRFFGSVAAIRYNTIEQCTSKRSCYGVGDDRLLNAWRNHIPPLSTVSFTAGAYGFNRRLTLAARISRNNPGVARKEIASSTAVPMWDGFTVVEAFGSYQFNDMLSADFAVENLFDAYYKDPLANVSQPGPGRTFRFNMTAKF